MRRARRALDPILAATGVLFGLGSVAYPFGRDQGLYYYVAREWVLRGAVPYRDVLDHKTPGIYLLHALCVALFGEQMWGIRILDLVCVVCVGLIAAQLSARRGETLVPGVRGGTILATSVLFWGYLDFWNTAQSELWYGMFGIGAVAAAHRIEKDDHAAFIAGVSAGCALLTKPPSMWMVAIAVVVLGVRANGLTRLLRPALLFAAGAALVPGIVLGYFAAKGAIPAMIDIVVGANSFYVKHETGGTPYDAFRTYHWFYTPLLPALLLYTLLRLRKEDKVRFRITAAVVVAGYLAVSMQGKFYLLHWSVCIPAYACMVANAIRTISEKLPRAYAPAYVAALSALYLGSYFTYRAPVICWNQMSHAWAYMLGRMPHDEYIWEYKELGNEFWFWTSERVGNWLREHTTENDTVTVRGFQPEIYMVARRRHEGRFFWTTFLTNPARAYKREEWLKEDLDALKAHPPKYVVALTHIPQGPDSVSYFTPLGYRPVEVMWEFTILERSTP